MTDMQDVLAQLVELQSQIAFQDDTIAALNEALAADDPRAAVSAFVARDPRSLDGWAAQGDLGREALDVLGLAIESGLRKKQREVCILVARGLEHPVQSCLDQLPDPVPVRTNHHAATYLRVARELGLLNDFVIPGREVLSLWCQSSVVPQDLPFIGGLLRPPWQ